MRKDSMIDALPRIHAESGEYYIIEKPAGWVSIPGRDPKTPSVLAWLRERDPAVLPVHRIDRETSGLLLFARGPEFHREANRWFERHQIQKTYHALASGRPDLPAFQVREPIEGARAITQVSVLENFSRLAFLAEIQIATGKRHQIRIHLSKEGHPLLGDSTYSGPKQIGEVIVPRVALHASRLKFPTGETFTSELPPDFQGWIRGLRSEAG